MNLSTPGFLSLRYLLEFAQTYVHWLSDAIQPSHPLPSPSFAFDLSQHQGLFQWVGSSHQVARISKLQLHRQSFQWIFRVDFHQDWLVGSLQSKGLSRVSSSNQNWKASSFQCSDSFMVNSPPYILVRSAWSQGPLKRQEWKPTRCSLWGPSPTSVVPNPS